MRVLALDTSTELGSCALWDAGRLMQLFCPAGQSHSATLLPLVQQLMASAGLAFSQLDGFAFACGPGAFTGLRVACGVVQGLAVAADRPVLPVLTLEAMAARQGGDRVLTVLDARMHELYAARWQRVGGGYQRLGEMTVEAPEALCLPESKDWVLAGNALAAYPELAQRAAAAGFALQPELIPDAASVAGLAVPRLQAGEGLDAALAAPVYVRDKVAKTVAERLQEGGRA